MAATKQKRSSGAKSSGGRTTASGKGAPKKKAASKKTSAAGRSASSKGSSSYRGNVQKSNAAGEFPWTCELLLFAFLAVSVLLFISNLGKGGLLGGLLSEFLFGIFGIMSYLLPFLLFFAAAFLISNGYRDGSRVPLPRRVVFKLIAAVLLYLFLCVFSFLIERGATQEKLMTIYRENAADHVGGGLIGALIGEELIRGFGIYVAYAFTLLILVMCMVLITERSLFRGVARGSKRAYQASQENAARHRRMAEERRRLREERVASEQTAEGKLRRDHRVRGVDFSIEFPKEDSESIPGEKKEGNADTGSQSADSVKKDRRKDAQWTADKNVAPFPPDPKNAAPADEDPFDDFWEFDEPSIHISGEEAAADSERMREEAHVKEPTSSRMGEEERKKPSAAGSMREEVHAQQPASDRTEKTEQMKQTSLGAPGKSTKRSAAGDTALEEEQVRLAAERAKQEPQRAYRFPSLSLLQEGSRRSTGDSREHLSEMSGKLQRTLNSFGVKARVTNIVCGPTVTRYELQPEAGVKVSKITGLADDIKLSLAVSDIRFETPIPGKSAIGIEVPNRESVTVAFRELAESKEFQSAKSGIAFCAGKDISGHVIVADIAKMPHLLIAGATGSGKSVCINTIIMSILYHASPEDVKLIMVDPKVVELSVYNGIPHLLIPVVTDAKKAAGALHWAVSEMMERYRTFQEFGVRDMAGYNQRVEELRTMGEQEEANTLKKMPQIVIIVDELADLMAVASSEVEDSICRLAQLARAAGMHLVIATQRPSVNVITGLIKANMPSRIAFAVASGVDSRTILDMNGAEKLLGKGDMLYFPQSMSKPLRVQGALVSDREVSDVVQDIIDKNGRGGYNSDIEKKVADSQSSIGGEGGLTGASSDRDSYFVQAGAFVIEKGKGSSGMLQRMFKIGYNRAARIMNQLHEAGVVGPEEGTKPRRVLMTSEEFEQLCRKENLSI